jgi:hypothetical protein
LHSNVEAAAEEVKLNVALVAVVEAAGPPVIVVVGAVAFTVNVRLALCPVFPAASDCSARTVYVPFASAEAVADHDPPDGVAESVCRGVPDALVPLKILTCTVPMSPVAVPAAPPKVGVRSLVVP